MTSPLKHFQSDLVSESAARKQLQLEQALKQLEQGPILLYDGECGVCNSSVQWILRHEGSEELRFAAQQSPLGCLLREQAGVKESVESLLFVEAIDQKVKPRVWSNAALAVTKYLKGGWRLLGMLRLVPRPLRDFAYRTFARHRRQFAAQQCLVPPARTRARFLESAL